jgi:hypothetical protein
VRDARQSVWIAGLATGHSPEAAFGVDAAAPRPAEKEGTGRSFAKRLITWTPEKESVDGTPQGDTIDIYRGHHDHDVMVTENGVTSGPFQPTSRIVVFGYGGNNQITVAPDVRVPAWLDGGNGNNLLIGGGGNNVLIGGAGNDALIGGRDLLIGGSGKDVLLGMGGGDILISGSTSFDSNQVALAAIMSEWTSHDNYEQRVDDLTDAPDPGPAFGQRLNGNYFLDATTIQNDDISNLVIVGPGQNLLFVNDRGPNADIVVRFDHGRFFPGFDDDDFGPGGPRGPGAPPAQQLHWAR